MGNRDLDLNVLATKFQRGKTYNELAVEMGCEVEDINYNIKKFRRKSRSVNASREISSQRVKNILAALKKFAEDRTGVYNIQTVGQERIPSDVRAFYYRMAKDLDLTWADMGAFMGGRDHATAMHGCNNVFPLVYINNEDVKLAYDFFQSSYKGKFKNVSDELADLEQDYKKQIATWKAKFEEVYDQLLEEKEWRHRFQKLTGDIPDDKREVVHARMNAIVKML